MTHSGRIIDFKTGIRPEDICLEDISHHLSKICRFGGSLPLDVHYSVAQHSILLAKYCLHFGAIAAAKYYLFHDAAEAYIGDMVSGLKSDMFQYQGLDAEVSFVIWSKYNINKHLNDVAGPLDKRILIDECKAFLPKMYSYLSNNPHLSPLGVLVQNEKNPELTKQEFLRMCDKLNIRD